MYYTDLEAATSAPAVMPSPQHWSISQIAVALSAVCVVGTAAFTFFGSTSSSTSLFTTPPTAATTTVSTPAAAARLRAPPLHAAGRGGSMRVAGAVASAGFAAPAHAMVHDDWVAQASAPAPLLGFAATAAVAALGLALYSAFRTQRPQPQLAFAGSSTPGRPHTNSMEPQIPLVALKAETTPLEPITSVESPPTDSPTTPLGVEVGKYSLQGSSRAQNEDRYDLGDCANTQFLAVFDGHGGNAVSTWLQKELRQRIESTFEITRPDKSLDRCFRRADKFICQPQKGFLGMAMERGIGGAKCGSTAALAMLYEQDGQRKLCCAHVGDARVLIITKKGVDQLTEDHVPDLEDERNRIESKNPNPLNPMVRFEGETYRVRGMLALSRAFGDAYYKGFLQFEGVSYKNTRLDSGHGVIAEPDVENILLEPTDEYILVCSDGLFANPERGGGGGLNNEDVGKLIHDNMDKSTDELAEMLCRTAQDTGSTDDITVLLAKL